MENFVNFHILISHSPACLNRDDMNMQKSATFGGVRRVRISSQSLKRAMRMSKKYAEYFDRRSTRTRYLIDDLVSKRAKESAATKDAVEEIGLFLAALIEGKTKKEEIKKYKRDTNSGRIQHQVIPFSEDEISKLNELLIEAAARPAATRLDFTVDRFVQIEQEMKTKIDMDVALSGRMAASDQLYGVDGALAVAHAITTHTVDSDIDWFTAVDDSPGESGAGHLNTQEFSSGVFYRYASLNLCQLQKNLGDISRERALEIAQHLAHLLATVVPTAKQQSFAAHNLADCVLISFSDQPISLANAFEAPVPKKNDGFRKPSEELLLKYWEKLNRKYDLKERAAVFRVNDDGPLPDRLVDKPTLSDLSGWIASDGAA